VIVDLFAGPGGWSEGLRLLDPDLHALEVGLEWSSPACRTRAAAGHRTVQTDVAAYPTAPFVGKTFGLIASPPCQDWSAANTAGEGIDGLRGELVREVPRWASALRPDWVVCEQVPAVLPVWRAYAHDLRAAGYSTWAGILNAADYGVPQARQRAVLLASRVRRVTPPEPTHAESPSDDLFGDRLEPWRTLAAGLGWDAERLAAASRPPGEIRSAPVGYGLGWDSWGLHRPATTVTSTPRIGPPGYRGPGERQYGTGTVHVSIDELAALQSFRAGYPWQGNQGEQYLQIGNAVPPRLASHVLAAVTGLPVPAFDRAEALT